jgi:S1-C subfamily serine protease
VNANSRVGVQQDLAAGLQFGQATDRGLAINAIPQNHFFHSSGIRRGDVIVSYGGRPIRSHNDFRRWVVYQPGQRVPVVVLRQGRPETIYVVYDQRQPGLEQQAGYAQSSGAYLGVTFDLRHQGQAVIRTVNPGSPAEQAGLQPGDLIVAVNGTQVGGSQDVIRVVSSMQPGQAIDVAVSRQVVLGKRPGVAQAASYGPDVRVEASAVPPAVPAGPAPTASVQAGVYEDATVRSTVPDVPGTRVDNRVGRAADADNDGRAFDGDGRVGPAEGRAILPRRRN